MESLAFATCKAQNDSAFHKNNISKNVVYIEALNSGYSFFYEYNLWGTVNYERTIIYSEEFNCAIRMGFGYDAFFSQNVSHIYKLDGAFYTLPITFNFIDNPRGNHHTDAGLGVILNNHGWDGHRIFGVGYIGNLKYRYQKKTKGIYFSAGWTPTVYFDHHITQGINNFIFGTMDVLLNLATMGMSIGYHF